MRAVAALAAHPRRRASGVRAAACERQPRGDAQVMELNSKAREAARKALATSGGPKTSLDQRFQLTADDWLDFLQKEAQSSVYAANQVIVAQGDETDSLFQIARGCVRLEEEDALGRRHRRCLAARPARRLRRVLFS